MGFIIIILIGLIAIALCICMASLIIDYFVDRCGAKIKFKSFKKFYNINPDRWDIADCFVICKGKHIYDKEYFCFGFIDYIKYRLWKHKQEKYATEMRHEESISRMIGLVKEDIANTERFAKQEMQDVQDIFLKAIGNFLTDNKTVKQYERLIKELNVK